MKLRLIASLTIAAATVLPLSGCGPSADTETNTLTIYASRPSPIARQVITAFVEAHPKYEGQVRMLTLGAGELQQRVRAESNNPQADIWWGGTQQQFEQGVQSDLLSRPPQEVIDRVPSQFRGEEDLWLGEMQMVQIIFYNHDMLSPDEAPQDWDDLIESEFNNKILIRDVAPSGTMRSVYSALIGRAIEETGNLDDGYDLLRAIDRNTKDYTANPTDLYLRVQRQEAPIGIWNLQDILVQRSNGAPFTPVVPTSGSPILVDGVGKINGGPNSEAADDFLEFLFRDSTQKMLAENSFQLPTIPLEEPPTWVDEFEFNEMPVDWGVVNENASQWIDFWVQNIKNRS